MDTRVQLLRGNALIEAADLKIDNQIRMLDEGSRTTLLKQGLYRFNADSDTVAVYDGKAKVMSDDRAVELVLLPVEASHPGWFADPARLFDVDRAMARLRIKFRNRLQVAVEPAERSAIIAVARRTVRTRRAALYAASITPALRLATRGCTRHKLLGGNP